MNDPKPDVNGNYHGGDGRFVSLREYIEALLDEHEKSHMQLAKSIEVALTSMDKRLEGMNEFRSSLSDVTNRAVSRELFDQAFASRDTQIDALENWKARATGAAVVLVLFAGVIGAAIVKAFG